MADPLLLALDQGTTSTRAIVFDREGQPLVTASRPLKQSYPADGWVEHDAEEIFESSLQVLREALQKAGDKAREVVALGITNQRETVVIWERASGRPIHPAIVWQDRRTASACERLRSSEGQVAAVTGLLVDPYFSATKIAWLLDHVEGARLRAERGELLCGTIDSWLVWKLTGGALHATDATNASRTLLFDLERQAWSAEMLELFGVPGALLPEVRDTAGDYGQTRPELLGRSIPIRSVVGDQQGALMGQGCIAPGEIKSTYGTGCFMLLHTGATRPVSSARLLATVAARVDGQPTYALEGSIFVAGAAIQWMGEGLAVAGGPQAVEALARQARDDSAVILVPAFTGLGAPWWDADARGAVFGLTRDTGLAELARAAFDASALQTRDLLEAMRADAPHAVGAGVELRIDGGMARSAWFGQRLADLTGQRVRRTLYQEATALGAALFAGLAAGVYGSVDEAAARRPHGEGLEPALDVAAREGAYARWLDAIARVRS